MLGLGLGTSKGGFVDALAEVTNTKSTLFDGGDEYVNFGNQSPIQDIWASGGSVSCWIKPNTVSDNERILDKKPVGFNGWFISLDNVSGSQCKLFFRSYWSGNDYQKRTTNTVINLGLWNHIVITYNSDTFSNTATMYVNGVSVALTSVMQPTSGNSVATDNLSDLTAGCQLNSGSPINMFDGNIDEIAMWNDTLTANEVIQIYNSNRGTLDLSTNTGSYSSSANLKAWWRMGDEASTRVLDTDANNLVIPDMRKTFFTGKSIDFDGTDDFIEIGDADNLGGMSELSISFWIKIDGDNISAGDVIIDKGHADSYQIKINSNNRLQIFVNGDNMSSNNDSVLHNIWNHIVFTYDSSASEGKIYVNGSLDNTESGFSGSAIDDNSNVLKIGNHQTSSKFYVGKICDVAIWDTVLNANTIASIYNSGEPNNLTLSASYTAGSGVDKTANLQAYYRLGNTTLFGDNSEANVILDANATLGTELLPALSDSNYTGGSDLTLTMDGNELNVARDGSSDFDVVLASPITLETNTKYLFEIEVGAGSSSSGALINVRGDESVLGSTTYFNEYIGRLVKSAVAFTSDSSATGFFFQIVANINSQNFNIVNVSLKKILTATNTASMVNMSNFDVVDHAPNRNSGDMINFDATADIETDTP